MSDVTKIKRMIGQCDDLKQLREIEQAAKERRKVVWQRLEERKAEEAWDRVKGLTPGTKLYCCADGIFLGGQVYRGDSMEVNSIQPRAKRLWVKLANGKFHWFAPAGVARYDLRTDPPEKPSTLLDRKLGETLGAALASIAEGR